MSTNESRNCLFRFHCMFDDFCAPNMSTFKAHLVDCYALRKREPMTSVFQLHGTVNNMR